MPDANLVLDGMRAFGAPTKEIERVAQALEARKVAPKAAPRFGVWLENMPIVQAWVALETQWRHAGMAGVLTGLDYAGVGAWLQVFIKPKQRAEIMRGIQLMERAALDALAEQKEHGR